MFCVPTWRIQTKKTRAVRLKKLRLLDQGHTDYTRRRREKIWLYLLRALFIDYFFLMYVITPFSLDLINETTNLLILYLLTRPDSTLFVLLFWLDSTIVLNY